MPETIFAEVISMSMFGTGDYAYFYDDGRRMYHKVLGEVELTDESNWDTEASDLLRDANCSVGMLEPYAGIFVTADGRVVDAQYRMLAISMDV